MSQVHRWICRSVYRENRLQKKILPSVVIKIDLGVNLVEIGPGPSLSTDWLRRRSEQLSAVEIDHKLACLVETRLRNTNVRVVQGNGRELPFKVLRSCAGLPKLAE